MMALCIEEIEKNFIKGNKYSICPTLSGYQVTDENDITFGFDDDTFKKYFEIIQ